MNTISYKDIKLIQEVSDAVLDLVIQGMNGELNDVTLGDLQAIAEATAMKIIKKVQEA